MVDLATAGESILDTRANKAYESTVLQLVAKRVEIDEEMASHMQQAQAIVLRLEEDLQALQRSEARRLEEQIASVKLDNQEYTDLDTAQEKLSDLMEKLLTIMKFNEAKMALYNNSNKVGNTLRARREMRAKARERIGDITTIDQEIKAAKEYVEKVSEELTKEIELGEEGIQIETKHIRPILIKMGELMAEAKKALGYTRAEVVKALGIRASEILQLRKLRSR